MSLAQHSRPALQTSTSSAQVQLCTRASSLAVLTVCSSVQGDEPQAPVMLLLPPDAEARPDSVHLDVAAEKMASNGGGLQGELQQQGSDGEESGPQANKEVQLVPQRSIPRLLAPSRSILRQPSDNSQRIGLKEKTISWIDEAKGEQLVATLEYEPRWACVRARKRGPAWHVTSDQARTYACVALPMRVVRLTRACCVLC